MNIIEELIERGLAKRDDFPQTGEGDILGRIYERLSSDEAFQRELDEAQMRKYVAQGACASRS